MLEVALAGNPNTGKTTLFNTLTGAHAHVGNYPGITVERRVGTRTCANGETWRVHDLPGCYSLAAHSPEEEIAHQALTGRLGDAPFDAVVVVLDATNLARNLLLLVQIAELDLPVIAALNMMDAAAAEGLDLDLVGLAADLGCPCVPMVARKGIGLPLLEQAVRDVAGRRQAELSLVSVPSAEMRRAIEQARVVLGDLVDGRSDGEVLWWLCSDRAIVDRLQPGLGKRLELAVPRAQDPTRDVRRQVTESRYARIDPIVVRRVRRVRPRAQTPSERIDRWALHPVIGTGLFVVAMALLFQAVFLWANPAIEAVDHGMAWVTGLVHGALPPGLLSDILVDGVLSGVAGTLVFLPQILMLFLGIALLEDSGYLARTAFLVDRLMARVGLPGKAFVPLLSSFACAVPGIMATRTMGDRRDRLLTMLVAPLMSCSARLPVYTLVTAAVFAGTAPVLGFLSVGGLVVAAMYGLGFLLAIAAAFVLRRTAVKGGGAPLLLEMPPYRWPRPRNILRALKDRAWVFVTQTGAVIVALSVLLWVLMAFPRFQLPAEELASRQAAVAQTTAPDSPQRVEALRVIQRDVERRQLEQSIAGHLGKAIEPLIAPLGFDWRIGIGLIGSFAAREVLVPVMGQVYGRGHDDSDEAVSAVGQTMLRSGTLTPLRGVSLMVFFAIAMQCLSTVATLKRETNSWKWPVFALTYLNALAWLASFVVYQIGAALGYA
ncbi:MAG: ferrous iron transport protein B [Myxococcota bacterium]